MKSLFERFWLYLSYFLLKADEHSLQAPFAYSFYKEIIRNNNYQHIPEIEEHRKKIINSRKEINYQSMGKISRLPGKSRSKISEISKKGISSFRKSRLFYNIIRQYNHETIIELGTSLGINTCYLSRAVGTGVVYTFEGHPELCEIANSIFEGLKLKNIRVVEGNINETLPQLTHILQQIDFALIDANHHSEALISYFDHLLTKLHEKSIVVIDDIRWSDDMYFGWKEITRHKSVGHTFDLGSLGILTFEKIFTRQNYILGF